MHVAIERWGTSNMLHPLYKCEADVHTLSSQASRQAIARPQAVRLAAAAPCPASWAGHADAAVHPRGHGRPCQGLCEQHL